MLNNSHRKKTTKAIYSCHQEVTWVVETYGLTLIHHELEKKLVLRYPEAAIWDFVWQGFEYSRILNLMIHIAGISTGEADDMLRSFLENMVDKGFLQKSI